MFATTHVLIHRQYNMCCIVGNANKDVYTLTHYSISINGDVHIGLKNTL